MDTCQGWWACRQGEMCAGKAHTQALLLLLGVVVVVLEGEQEEEEE